MRRCVIVALQIRRACFSYQISLICLSAELPGTVAPVCGAPQMGRGSSTAIQPMPGSVCFAPEAATKFPAICCRGPQVVSPDCRVILRSGRALERNFIFATLNFSPPAPPFAMKSLFLAGTINIVGLAIVTTIIPVFSALAKRTWTLS